MRKENVFDRDRRAALAHAIARKDRPSGFARTRDGNFVERTPTDENGAKAAGWRQAGGEEVVHLRRNERGEGGVRFREILRVPNHRQCARAGKMTSRVNAKTTYMKRRKDRGPNISVRYSKPFVDRGCGG